VLGPRPSSATRWPESKELEELDYHAGDRTNGRPFYETEMRHRWLARRAWHTTEYVSIKLNMSVTAASSWLERY